jgi:hypothetical protein
MIFTGYYVWKVFNVLSYEDELTIFDTNKVPALENTDVLMNSYSDENFKCDLHDGYSDASNIVVIKFSKEGIEELRIIVPLDWEFDKEINTKEKLNIEEGFLKAGYTDLQITNSKKFNSKNGKLSFRSLYQGSLYSGEDVRENCIKSLPKNDLELGNIILGWEKKTSFLNKESGGFSFTWDKGEYEAFNLYAEKPKTILKPDEVNVTFPCCSSNNSFSKDLLQKQWGVQKLYCKSCDKYHTDFDKYFSYKNKEIDFTKYGIEGYKDEKESIIYGSVIRPIQKGNNKLNFLTNE